MSLQVNFERLNEEKWFSNYLKNFFFRKLFFEILESLESIDSKLWVFEMFGFLKKNSVTIRCSYYFLSCYKQIRIKYSLMLQLKVACNIIIMFKEFNVTTLCCYSIIIHFDNKSMVFFLFLHAMRKFKETTINHSE